MNWRLVMEPLAAGGGQRPARAQRVRQIVAVVFALVFAGGVSALAMAWALSPMSVQGRDVQVASAADFCVTVPQAVVPGAECKWKRVALPKDYGGHVAGPLRDGWFKVRFDLVAVPTDGIAMMVTTFNRTGRVFVNGTVVRVVGPMVDPMPLNWNRAQYWTVPATLLRVGANEVEVEQRTHKWEAGALSALRIGAVGVVLPLYERRVWWQNDLVEALAAMTGAFGLVMLGVWFSRRSEASYFWFGCACFTWVWISLDFFAPYPILPPLLWEKASLSVQVLRGVVMFTFCLRYCGMRKPRLEWAMWLYLAAGVVMLAAMGVRGDLADVWFLGPILAAPYFGFLMVREGLKRSPAEGGLLCAAAVAQSVLSAYDVWLYDADSRSERIFLAHYTVPLYLLVVGVILIRHFVASLRGYEQLNTELEHRVAEKSDELAGNYERLVEARKAETLATERSRIMSEMHDGIGSQLTSALSLVRQLDRRENPSGHGQDGPIAKVLRESIEDLQLIVDSLEPVENDLLTVLGTLRYRLQDRLCEAGVELQWRVVDLPPLPMLTPHSVLSILRITQEAFANALKHSGANRIEVVTGLLGEVGDGEAAFICVIDNGRGFAGGREGGRGLKNMHERAKSLNGSLSIESRPGYTEVLLVFPTMREIA